MSISTDANTLLTDANIQILIDALPVLLKCKNGTIPGSLITPGSITSNQIAAGALLAQHYAPQSVAPGVTQQGAINNLAAASLVIGPFTVGKSTPSGYNNFLFIRE